MAAAALALMQATATPAKTQCIVCVGGYNHSAGLSGDTLEIQSAGLPQDFSLASGDHGYFQSDSKQRFMVVSLVRDEKLLTVKIIPET